MELKLGKNSKELIIKLFSKKNFKKLVILIILGIVGLIVYKLPGILKYFGELQK